MISEEERRRTAEHHLRKSMPGFQKALDSIQDQLSMQVIDISRHHAELVDVSRIVQNVEVPTLRLDYESLFPDLTSIHESALKTLGPTLELIQDAQRDKFAALIEASHHAVQAALPPNWRSGEVSIPENLEALLLDEGLALAWVPPAPIVAKLFNSNTASDRRRIIGSRWKHITHACVSELQRVDLKSLSDYAHFAREGGRCASVRVARS